MNKNGTGRTAQEWCNMWVRHARRMKALSEVLGLSPPWQSVEDDERLIAAATAVISQETPPP